VTRRLPGSPGNLLAACAVAALLTACGTTPPRTGAAPANAVVQRARQSPQASAPPIDRAAAVTVARRFAAAFAAWDAGPRSPGQRSRLAASTTPGVLAALATDGVRPVARPARPLPLTPLGAYRGARGRYRVPLVRADHPGRQVVTVIVAATARGPRVVALER
jgi:hypothetical protein